MAKKHDPVNHPKHYKQGNIEVIDIIEDFVKDMPGDEGYRMGNAIKYIFRHKHKAKPIEDLKKSSWYINRNIDKLIKKGVK